METPVNALIRQIDLLCVNKQSLAMLDCGIELLKPLSSKLSIFFGQDPLQIKLNCTLSFNHSLQSRGEYHAELELVLNDEALFSISLKGGFKMHWQEVFS